jgi:hypothetical protein
MKGSLETTISEKIGFRAAVHLLPIGALVQARCEIAAYTGSI